MKKLIFAILISFLAVLFFACSDDPPPSFIPVVDVEIVLKTVKAGDEVALVGFITPFNATNQTISWSITNAGTTGASIINGNILRTVSTGIVSVSATVRGGAGKNNNFTADFDIDVGAETLQSFWAINSEGQTITFYQTDAVLLASGTYCEVWVEKKNGVTVVDIDTAEEVAEEYDGEIHLQMIEAFCDITRTSNRDAMEWADLWGDNNGKLCILLLDIKDGYNPPGRTSYIAGYFWGGDLFAMENSNRRDIIFIDTDPGFTTTNSKKTAFRTLAHEMQHVISFVHDQLLRQYYSDIWINEGLSSAAEWIYSGDHGSDDPNSRFNYYNEGKGLIPYGNNFYCWDHYANPEYVLDDYATVYLFFQWLRLQSEANQLRGPGIYKRISTSPHDNFWAVTTSTNINVNTVSANRSAWETLLRNWLIANYLNLPASDYYNIYGYQSDDELKNVKATYIDEEGNTSIILYPGEAVYSYVKSSFSIPSSAGIIKYRSLRSGSSSISFSGYATSGGAILAYNSDTVKDYFDGWDMGAPEVGIITGHGLPSIVKSFSSISVQEAVPYPVSISDMLRQNEYRRKGQLSDLKLSKNGSVKTESSSARTTLSSEKGSKTKLRKLYIIRDFYE